MRAFRGLLACVLLGAILAESKEQTQPTADSSNSGCANFAGELYHRVQESLQEREHFAISPVGVSSLLGALLFAVDQTSAREISNFLYPKCESSREVAPRPAIPQRQGSEITMATVAMARKGVAVDKQFEDQAEELGFSVIKTSFITYSEDFNTTNDRFFYALQGISYDPPDLTTRLLFYNRLSYRAQFAQKFSLVKGNLFAPRVQALYAHVPELKARVLGLPLLNTTSFLLILLPEQGNDLSSVERRLRKVDVRKLPSKLNATTMDITLDSIFEEKSIYLRDALRKAGITTVFNETTADLSAFNREVPLDDALVVTKMYLTEDGIDIQPFADRKHNAVVRVADASTYPEFKALGPLIYAVVDSERVYLMGRSFGRKPPRLE